MREQALMIKYNLIQKIILSEEKFNPPILQRWASFIEKKKQNSPLPATYFPPSEFVFV